MQPQGLVSRLMKKGDDEEEDVMDENPEEEVSAEKQYVAKFEVAGSILKLN